MKKSPPETRRGFHPSWEDPLICRPKAADQGRKGDEETKQDYSLTVRLLPAVRPQNARTAISTMKRMRGTVQLWRLS